MIDYLEALFAPEQPEEKQEPGSFSGAGAEWSEPEEMALPFLMEEGEEQPAPAMRGEDYWQEEGLRRVEHALTQPGKAYSRPDSEPPETLARALAGVEAPTAAQNESAVFSRPQNADGAWDLERRLRRDSRRYDSGFFWY